MDVLNELAQKLCLFIIFEIMVYDIDSLWAIWNNHFTWTFMTNEIRNRIPIKNKPSHSHKNIKSNIGPSTDGVVEFESNTRILYFGLKTKINSILSCTWRNRSTNVSNNTINKSLYCQAFKSATFNTNTPWYGNTYDTKVITIIYEASRYNAMPEVVSSANVCIRFNGLKYTSIDGGTISFEAAARDNYIFFKFSFDSLKKIL